MSMIGFDPKLIPLGSRIFIPAYCGEPNRGWFVAQDTGGAVISGQRVDVYRPAPESPDGGQLVRGQQIFVLPPTSKTIMKQTGPRAPPSCRARG